MGDRVPPRFPGQSLSPTIAIWGQLLYTAIFAFWISITCWHPWIALSLFCCLLLVLSRQIGTRKPRRLLKALHRKFYQPFGLLVKSYFRLIKRASADPWIDYSLLPSLHDDTVRLVLVGRVSRTGPLECEFETCGLSDKPNLPKYHAISYTWSSGQDAPQQDHVIRWYWRQIPVTRSCFDAIKAVLDGHECNAGYFWIDQLCIDQSNPEEKAAQIDLMGQIYKSANGISVWLGEQDEPRAKKDNAELGLDYEVAFQCLKPELGLSLESLVSDVYIDDIRVKVIPNADRDSTSYDIVLLKGIKLIESLAVLERLHSHDKAYGTDHLHNSILNIQLAALLLDKEAWIGLMRVYRCRYFSRRWIIQECTRPETYRCYISGYVLSMSIVWESANVLDRLVHGQRPALAKLMNLDLVSMTISGLTHELKLLRGIRYVHDILRKQEELPISAILIRTNTTQYTDERDMFFALRTLVSDQPQLPRPDYKSTAYSVYLEHIIYIIRTTQVWQLLTKSGLFNGRQTLNNGTHYVDLPTWCPPWRSSNSNPLPRRYIIDLNTSPLSADDTDTNSYRYRWGVRLLRAGWGPGPKVDLNADGTKLSVGGRLYGTVTNLSPLPFVDPMKSMDLVAKGDTATFDLTRTWVMDTSIVLWACNVASIDTLRGSIRTFVKRGCRRSASYSQFVRYERDERDVFQRHTETVWEALDYLLTVYHMFDTSTITSPVTCHGHYLAQYQELLPRRRLVILDNGVMGLVPDITEEGDIVAIFDRFEVPMVVRRVPIVTAVSNEHFERDKVSEEDCYQVVGDAYFMQVAEDMFDVPSRTFVLV